MSCNCCNCSLINGFYKCDMNDYRIVDESDNLVKVILTGDYELKSIIISEEAKKENQEIINDLIIAAYNNAKENLKKKSAEELSKVTGGLNLPPDFKLPF